MSRGLAQRAHRVVDVDPFPGDATLTYDSDLITGPEMELTVSETALFPRHLVIRLIVGFLVLFALATLCGLFLMEPIERLGTAAVTQFGLLGLFVAILLIDSFPTPMSYAPLMLLAIQGGMPIWVVFIASSLASMSGGLIGYSIGRLVGLPKRLEGWLEAKHPDQFILLKEHGAWGVAAVAALPLPFALGTWTAGAMKVRLGGVFLACLVRIPKTAFYIALIMGGLKLGGG